MRKALRAGKEKITRGLGRFCRAEWAKERLLGSRRVLERPDVKALGTDHMLKEFGHEGEKQMG